MVEIGLYLSSIGAGFIVVLYVVIFGNTDGFESIDSIFTLIMATITPSGYFKMGNAFKTGKLEQRSTNENKQYW